MTGGLFLAVPEKINARSAAFASRRRRSKSPTMFVRRSLHADALATSRARDEIEHPPRDGDDGGGGERVEEKLPILLLSLAPRPSFPPPPHQPYDLHVSPPRDHHAEDAPELGPERERRVELLVLAQPGETGGGGDAPRRPPFGGAEDSLAHLAVLDA
eukprot:31332-Pelagococcus_subviridis.AAC.1